MRVTVVCAIVSWTCITASLTILLSCLLLRALAPQRVTVSEPTPTESLKWEPVAFDFSAKEVMARLEKGDARELGVSISSSSSSLLSKRPAAASSTSNSLLAAIADMQTTMPSMGMHHHSQINSMFQ